jgi:hypothetical protein
MSVRTITTTAVAGIPFVHHVPDGLPVLEQISPGWTASRVCDEPVHIHHEVGDTSPVGLSPVVAAPPPLGTYYVDEVGQLAVRSTGREGVYLPQLMRTIQPGFSYSIRYERAEDALRMQWGWQRTIFMFALASRGRGAATHACGFLLPGGAGVICPGMSGAGKSTLARLLATEAPDATVLGDDRVAITVEPSGLHLWSSPWHSSARIARSGDGPLSAVAFLRHGTGNELRELSPSEASRRLLRTLAFPFWDHSLMHTMLELVDRIVSETPVMEFTFQPAGEAARWLVQQLADSAQVADR